MSRSLSVYSEDLTTTTLQLVEIFSSVQGESSLTGLPTTFIRLAGCNLRCSWCDTPYSFGRGYATELSTILQQVEQNGCRYVCVTGGEPLLQRSVYPLMKILCDQGYRVSLETGGALSIQEIDSRVKTILDIKCPGSGMSHKNLWQNLNYLPADGEVKFVLLDHNDYLWAKDVCERYNLWGDGLKVLFSPVHGHVDPKELVNWMLEDRLPVRLNLQVHKYIWSPQTRGV
jgi:7-carboxy-7-deazaguanine synthase